MIRQTLITEQEVIYYGGISITGSPCSFRNLFNIEYREFRNCLGIDFREDILGAVVDYSSKPNYTSGTTYALGDIVRFNGSYYKAKKETTLIPSMVSDWEIAPKFSGTCSDLYEELYCMFLAEYLALVVLRATAPFLATQIGSEGIIQFQGTNFKPADEKAVSVLQNAINQQGLIVWNNMVAWIKDDDHNRCEEACFENLKICKNGGCGCVSVFCSTSKSTTGGYRFG